MKKAIFFVFTAILLVGCGPSESAIATAIAETQAASVTDTPLPSETPTTDPFELTKVANQTQNAIRQSTSDAMATNLALTPTKTRTSTPTKVPTATKIPFDPVILTGSGDSIVDVDLPVGFIGILHIVGNASGRHFAVKNLDANNESIDLLVNTTDPYDGWRPLDFLDDEQTKRFEVSARGEWLIEIFPLDHIERLTVPGTITGTGDFVFAVIGDPDLAIINGNKEDRYFGVRAYGGNGVDLLVSTTDPYEGTVLLDLETVVIEVISEGDWSIEITSK